MPIFDLYSKRQKRLRGEVSEVFSYDEIPQPLRIQIIHIWHDAIGRTKSGSQCSYATDLYDEIHSVLCREYGVFRLSERGKTSDYELQHFFQECEDNDKVVDVIEVVFFHIDTSVRDSNYQLYTDRRITPEDAIEDLNKRFLEHAIGYQFESGQIIRKDSELIHIEVVKPTLNFLSRAGYEGANEEFLNAHEHYRHGRYKESLNDCLKAFESTMKVICQKRGWAYNENDTAKKLIETCLVNGLIPNFLQTQITTLKSILESGIPTVRNKLGGHGQGSQQTIVPSHIASYMIHLTATTILLFVESEKQLP